MNQRFFQAQQSIRQQRQRVMFQQQHAKDNQPKEQPQETKSLK